MSPRMEDLHGQCRFLSMGFFVLEEDQIQPRHSR